MFQCLNKLRVLNETSVGGTMLVTHAPCGRCSREIVAAKISKVVYKENYRDLLGIEYLKDHGVIVEQMED